jgi:hypothetical protein
MGCSCTSSRSGWSLGSSKSWWGVVREKVTLYTSKPTRGRGEPMTTPTRGGGGGRRGPRDAPGEGRARGGRGARRVGGVNRSERGGCKRSVGPLGASPAGHVQPAGRGFAYGSSWPSERLLVGSLSLSRLGHTTAVEVGRVQQWFTTSVLGRRDMQGWGGGGGLI